MMEIENFITMLKRAGVAYSMYSTENGTDVEILSRPEPGNVGYYGFFTQFSFNPDGNLFCVGVWE